MKKFILTIPGILLSVFGGGMFICCLFGAIEDEFQPVHVYLSLFFSFGVILALGIVMIYFGHKKNVKSKEGADYNYTPVQTPDKKTVKILLQELQKRTSQDSIKIQIEENRKPTLFGSKIGGIPYWDKKREYPKDSDGSKLMLLAQMNLNELPENQMLPRTGILQFFILCDRNYGMAIQESGYPNNTYQVVYHEKIDESITEADVLSIGIKTTGDLEKENKSVNQQDSNCFPVRGEYAVSFKMEKAYMNDCDVRCDELLHKIAEELGVELDSRLEFYQMFDEYDKKYVDIHESTYGHRMFGYPHFRQWDPRGVEAADYYDTLLFQLDSDYWKNQWRILWGDAGVGAFFINSKKLEELDFGDVLYNWDCH
ncbi:MAG: YwqG family protein [Oscillospiraceae bacterium]